MGPCQLLVAVPCCAGVHLPRLEGPQEPKGSRSGCCGPGLCPRLPLWLTPRAGPFHRMRAPVVASSCVVIGVHRCFLMGCSQPCGGGAVLCVPVGCGPNCRGRELRYPRKMRPRQGSWSMGRRPPQSQVVFHPSSPGRSSGLLSLSSNWQQCPYHLPFPPQPHHQPSQASCPPHLGASLPLILMFCPDSPQTLLGSSPSHNPDGHRMAWVTTAAPAGLLSPQPEVPHLGQPILRYSEAPEGTVPSWMRAGPHASASSVAGTALLLPLPQHRSRPHPSAVHQYLCHPPKVVTCGTLSP